VKSERHQRISPFTASVEFRNGGQAVWDGDANFDSEPYFPSFALLLDDVNALVLKAIGPSVFSRIGIARIGLRKHERGSNNAGLGAASDMSSRVDSSGLTYSVQEVQAAKLASGSRQIVTIY
jgi:hypothetical protein